jgi:hypothetical protein
MVDALVEVRVRVPIELQPCDERLRHSNHTRFNGATIASGGEEASDNIGGSN